MLSIQYVFTIFFLTLGPIKTIPTFHVLTRDADPADLRKLALRGVLIATALSLAIALIMAGVLKGWQVSPDAMRIAGSILLFISALQIIGSFGAAAAPPASPPIGDPKVLRRIALTPLAIPTIVTPWGVAAILMFMSIARGNPSATEPVLIILVGIMVLNYLGMLVARQVCGFIGLTTFQIIGWVFAVMQAGLATEGIIYSLRAIGVIPNAQS